MGNDNINKGPVVTAAGTGINLALGVLYTWSIFKGAIKSSIEEGTGGFDWELASLNDPYAVCCFVFAFAMILAGKCQDVIGPRKTATIGGVLVGAGFVWISQSTAYLSWVLGFGVLCGTGIAFGYSSATPAALKWYPPDKTGRISGIVVSGFGLASVYIAPLAKYLLGVWGLQGAMLFFGIAFLIVVSVLATFLKNPPEGYVPTGFADRRSGEQANASARTKFEDVNARPLDMIRSPVFWTLWLLYFVGAGAGLMVIGSVAGMAKQSMGEQAFLAVAILAVGNAGGRVAAGMLSDKIGRKRTLAAMFAFQALLMFIAIPVVSSEAVSALVLIMVATFIGFNYGANLALFPSFTKDFWGMKNFGVNYGIIFTAWGMGGLVMSRVSQSILAERGSFTDALIVAGVLLVAGGLGTLLIRDSKDEMRQALKRRPAT
jgi:nitrate/nitrite transporter NarK